MAVVGQGPISSMHVNQLCIQTAIFIFEGLLPMSTYCIVDCG